MITSTAICFPFLMKIIKNEACFLKISEDVIRRLSCSLLIRDFGT